MIDRFVILSWETVYLSKSSTDYLGRGCTQFDVMGFEYTTVVVLFDDCCCRVDGCRKECQRKDESEVLPLK